MMGMGSGGGSSARGPRIEYQFLARPKGGDAFKKLLTQQGNDGWEYVGLVPGDDELIFKRQPRPAGGGFGGFGGGMAPFGGGGAMPGMGGVMPGPGGFGGGFGGGMQPGGLADPFGGARGGPAKGPSGLPGGGRLGGSKSDPTGPGPAEGPGGDTVAVGGAAKGPVTITLRVGETIRHTMKSQRQIDRVFNHDLKVVDADPDPTDSKRILIKGLASGGARLELTDANGAKEEYIVRVR